MIFDSDLAALYSLETKALNQAVRRNSEIFLKTFMIPAVKNELENWRSQIVTSNPAAKMGLRNAPYVLTEHSIAMLSSVPRSQRAVETIQHLIEAPEPGTDAEKTDWFPKDQT